MQIFERIEASVISEGARGAEFVELNVAFQNHFGGRGDFEVDGFALDEIDGGSAQEACDEVFLDVWWRGDDSGKSDGRVGADGDGDLHAPAGAIAVGEDGASGAARHDIDRGARVLVGVVSSRVLADQMAGSGRPRAVGSHTVRAGARV